jgi:hypothetical protein
MDRVRFGRALGVGARQAAKTLMSAAEAAAAPNPGEGTRPVAAAPVTRPVARVVADPKVVKTQAKTLGKSVLGPFAKFSSVLWLEVTGLFFAIFAAIAGVQVWKWRAAVFLPTSSPDARRFYVYAAVFVVFGYFAVSSFLRAGRRSRR